MATHSESSPLSVLLGTWQGQGRGVYPTISDFSYRETVSFSSIEGKPFFVYLQKTASPTGSPMHTESGFLRPTGPGTVEFVIAQPTGQTELIEGTYSVAADGSLVIEFTESTVHNSSTAKQVDATARRYEISADGSAMVTSFEMAAVGEKMQNHLVSELAKS